MKDLESLLASFPDAKVMPEGGIEYLYLPKLTFPSGASALKMDALLCPQRHGGYLTRLFLERPVPGKGANWTTHYILGKAWHTWSWNNVAAESPVLEILGSHLRALR